MAQPSRARVPVLRRPEDADHRDVAELTPGERLGLMWQLACDAWAFKGDAEAAESRMQRHVVRVYRRRR